MLIADSIERVRAFRRAMGWSVQRLATEAGMRESAIRRINQPDWNPESKTLRRLEAIIPLDFVVEAPAPTETAA